MDDPHPRLILSVDTSLAQLSVALSTPGRLLGAVSLEGKDSRNQKLLPAIDWLLRESSTAREEIDLFAVTRGPGSFTGVRIGLATVQGLALALRRPVCAMSTHEAASRACDGARSALVFGDAGRTEFYVSAFRDGEEEIAPTLLSREQLDGLRARYQDALDLAAVALTHNVALLAAERAREIISRGRLDQYGHVSPIYVRLAEAEVKLSQRTS
jgi:tRNA threonylcarbamoyl adenosine modification protein YeaZ